MSPWKVILATMVIFGCGVVTGFFLMKSERPPVLAIAEQPSRTVNSQKPPSLGQLQRPEFMRRMERQLDLTTAQRDQIAKIIKDSQERSKLLWEQVSPQMREEIKRVRGEVREVLTPDQRVKFTELLKSHPRKGETNEPPEHVTVSATNAL